MRKWGFHKFVTNFDIYPKLSIDVRKKTSLGGLLAIISLILILILMYFQIDLLITSVPAKYVINTNFIPRTKSGKLDFNLIPKMRITFDITFLHVPCAFINIKILDNFKEPISFIDGKFRMQRYDLNNQPIYDDYYPTNEKVVDGYCGPCYSLKKGCCNTCKEVCQLFENHSFPIPSISTLEQCMKGEFKTKIKEMQNEKCRVHGSILVKQHPGYIFFGYDASHSDFINMSHHIHKFAFGGRTNKITSPLNNKISLQTKEGKIKTNYFIRLVPIGLDNCMYAYSSSSVQNYRNKNSTKQPVTLFKYDISPLVVIHEKSLTTTEFISQCFAIIGGIYAIFTFIDLFSAEIFDQFFNSGLNLPKLE